MSVTREGHSVTTLYIAGPMTGYPEFNYPAFRAAEAQLRAAGYATLNPSDISDPGDPQPWDRCMRHALRMVLDADGLALLPGWAKSKGATLEVHVAQALLLPVRRLQAWLR